MSKTLGARFSLTAKPQDGVTYVIRTAAERAYISPNTSTATFTSDYRFFRSKGGRETAVAVYVVIAVRAKDGSRSIKLRVHNATVSTVASFGINVTTADAAIEVYIFDTAPTVSNYLTTYVAKKEIPVEKQADRQRRIRWMQGGLEITVLACAAGGTPKTYRDLTVQLVENVNGTDTVMAAAANDSWEVVGFNKSTAQWVSINDDVFEDNQASALLDWSEDQDMQTSLEACNRLRVSMTVGGTPYTSVLPFVCDGATGARGAGGPVPVPCGVWQAGKTYTATAVQTDYVYDPTEKAFFYVTPPTSGTRTATVGVRPGLNPSHWTRMSHYEALHASLAVINGGTVGKAVFWEEFMYSQYGRNRILDNNYNITGYEEVDGVTDSDGDGTPNTYGAPVQTGNPTDTFEPNLLLNFLTGDAMLRNAYLENGFFTGFRRCVPTVITPDNIGRMIRRSRFLQVSGQYGRVHKGTEADPNSSFFDLKRVGSSIVISGSHPLYVNESIGSVSLHLPFLMGMGGSSTFLIGVTEEMQDGGITARREMMRVRSYLGCTIEVLNLSADTLPVFGLVSSIQNKVHNDPWQAFYLPQGRLLRATCKRGMDYSQYTENNSNYMAANERIYWELEAFLWSFDSNYFDAGLLNSLDE